MAASVRRIVPGLVAGLCLGLLALGPGLRRGFLLSYDMVFVPRMPFSTALPGLDPPRAVPSDLVIAVASRIVPGDIVQKLVLLAIFVLACAGAAALLDREPLLARLAGGVFYAWNPYVGERLIIGQWALLLGYAGLPWVLRAMISPNEPGWRWTARLCLSLVPAVIGGFAAMAITALVLVPAALLTRSVRRAAIALAALVIGSLPWLIPALQHPVYADPGGVAAFAARADTPFGSVGSLLMLGGSWNAQTVPKGYGGAWSALWLAVVFVALAGYLPSAVRERRWPGLGVAAIAGLLIACIGVTAPGRDLLRSVIGAWPGAAVLRDAQQFVAPLALAEAAGFGVVVARAMNPAVGPGRRGNGRPGPVRGGSRGARPPGAGAPAARPGLGRRRTAAAGLVPGRVAGRRAHDRCQPGPRRRAAAAVGDLPQAGLEPRRGGVRPVVQAAVAPGDLERRDPGRRRRTGAGRPACAAARRRDPRRRAADRGPGRGRGEVRRGRRGRTRSSRDCPERSSWWTSPD